jgi:hypothetical protein
MKSKHYNKTTEILGKHSVMVEFGIQIFFTCKENTESKLYNKQKKKIEILGKYTASWQNLAHKFSLPVKTYGKLYNKTQPWQNLASNSLENSSLDEVTTNYFHKQILHFN